MHAKWDLQNNGKLSVYMILCLKSILVVDKLGSAVTRLIFNQILLLLCRCDAPDTRCPTNISGVVSVIFADDQAISNHHIDSNIAIASQETRRTYYSHGWRLNLIHT